MKIDYAIHSVNNNPLYLDFWPLVAKLWKLKMDTTPILVYVGDQKPTLDESYGQVIHLKQLPHIPEAMQAQWARFWYAQKYPEHTCIISDIDMLPISKSHFVQQLQHIDENHYVHLNACIEVYGALPACYHVAKGKVLKSLLQLDDDWEKSVTKLLNFNNSLPSNFKYHNNGSLWFADERYSTHLIMDVANEIEKHLINRIGGYDALRIDRAHWKYHYNLLKLDYYIDCHFPRPYQDYSEEIDKVVQTALIASDKRPGRYETTFEKVRSTLLHKVRLLNN